MLIHSEEQWDWDYRWVLSIFGAIHSHLSTLQCPQFQSSWEEDDERQLGLSWQKRYLAEDKSSH